MFSGKGKKNLFTLKTEEEAELPVTFPRLNSTELPLYNNALIRHYRRSISAGILTGAWFGEYRDKSGESGAQ